jgi:hypothetical protein
MTDDFVLICKCGSKMRAMGELENWFLCESSCGNGYHADLDFWVV